MLPNTPQATRVVPVLLLGALHELRLSMQRLAADVALSRTICVALNVALRYAFRVIAHWPLVTSTAGCTSEVAVRVALNVEFAEHFASL